MHTASPATAPGKPDERNSGTHSFQSCKSVPAYPPKYDELPYFTAEGTTGDRFGKFRESVVSAEFFLYVGFQRIVSELKFSCMSVKDRKRDLYI